MIAYCYNLTHIIATSSITLFNARNFLRALASRVWLGATAGVLPAAACSLVESLGEVPCLRVPIQLERASGGVLCAALKLNR